MANRNLVLLCGPSATGKTASLRNLQDPEGVAYLNFESGKELPFPSKFKVMNVTDPLIIFDVFDKANSSKKMHTIIIDSLTYMMDMFESKYVIPATNGMQAWSDYAQFFKKLMQEYVAATDLNVIFTAHTSNILNEQEMVMDTMVKVKGQLMTQGIESFFGNVIGCKKYPLTKLKGQESPLLNISDEEEMLGFKYVYQTRLTKETVNERIRGPIGLWSTKEIFIDNDLQGVIDQLGAYYAP